MMKTSYPLHIIIGDKDGGVMDMIKKILLCGLSVFIALLFASCDNLEQITTTNTNETTDIIEIDVIGNTTQTFSDGIDYSKFYFESFGYVQNEDDLREKLKSNIEKWRDKNCMLVIVHDYITDEDLSELKHEDCFYYPPSFLNATPSTTYFYISFNDYEDIEDLIGDLKKIVKNSKISEIIFTSRNPMENVVPD